MSHTLSLSRSGTVCGTLTVTSYTVGGEPVSLSEFTTAGSIAALQGLIMGTVPPGQNSLALPLMPVLSGSNILLFKATSSGFVEIPTTSGLNAVVCFLLVLN